MMVPSTIRLSLLVCLILLSRTSLQFQNYTVADALSVPIIGGARVGPTIPATRSGSQTGLLVLFAQQEKAPSSSPPPPPSLSPERKVELVHEFVQRVEQSVQEQTFVSLILQGTAPKKKKKKQQLTTEDPFLGSIRQVQGRLIQTKKIKDTSRLLLLQLTIKYHGATDFCKNMAPQEISVQLAHLILEPLASEWGVQAVQAQPFQGAELKTLHDTWELKALHPGTQATLRKKPNDKIAAAATTAVQPESHDRTKQVPLAQTSDTTFLQALGLSKPDGSPRPGMSSKLRQCNKFVEIVSGLIAKTTSDATASADSPTTENTLRRRIRVVDMGCGRAYLTFSLHSSLSEHYSNVESLGIDVRPKLVAEISGIAQSLGGNFEKLSFETGTIEEIVAGTTSIYDSNDADKDDEKSLDILIALHACDTATDDALWSGISQGAEVIVVAPCCHKEIRSQVNAHVATTKESHPLYDVLKHGVYRERLSETVTDSLRALLLEQAGYKVQVFEFIGGEHTSKNVMITAVRSRKASEPTDWATQNHDRIQELARFHGITRQKLAHWMGIDLGGEAISTKTVQQSGRNQVTATQMPPRVK